jgi:hypothetical protein
MDIYLKKEIEMKIKFFMFWMLVCLLVLPGCSSSEEIVTIPDAYPLKDTLPPPEDIEEEELIDLPGSGYPVSTTELTVVDPQNPALMPVMDFYQWYFEQPMGEVFNNRSYEDQTLLSEIFKSDLGYLLDSFETTAGYDPFICAQQTLPSLTFDPIFVSGGEAYALGQVLIEGEARHYLVVQLGKGEGDWKIDAIHCPFDPKTAGITFFTAYLGNIASGVDMEQGIDNPVNPIEDGFFNSFFLISDGYRQKIQETLGEDLVKDPILQTQTLPLSFWVEPGQEEQEITARLTYGPQSARYYILSLIQTPGYYWLIDDIEMEEIPSYDPLADLGADTADWQVFVDEDYGFSFKYPQGWSIDKADLSGMPQDDPMKKNFFFYPEWASENLPILWLNILEGTENHILNYYVTEYHQRVQINENTVSVDSDRYGTRYVFQHPEKENTWIVIGDTSPRMPGREQYQEELDSIIAPLLRTVDFNLN